ncbi:MAG: hypothetical protein BZY80_04760 [SAR202 cluster bacterium Io17-Chloro-G2]|nr:MAG: hypothetical protein BZY80_04760 [SAR202 cluster bacterium Io17-Chloro-G2]
MLCQLKSCSKCQGDLILDGDEWRCWQCGRHYYPRRSAEALRDLLLETRRESNAVPSQAERPQSRPPRRRATRSLRDVNSRIAARDRSDRRWWLKNMEIVRHLDEGKSVKEISSLVGRGQRQVRIVRERLYDMRSTKAPELLAG